MQIYLLMFLLYIVSDPLKSTIKSFNKR